MPVAAPRQLRKLGKRETILSAARSIVSEVGFQETSIAAVATASGVSTGSVYSYFASKAELMAEIVAAVSSRELAVLREIAASDAPVAGRLTAAVEAFARRAFANRRLAWSMIAEPADPAVDATRLDYRREIAGIFRALVVEGEGQGAFLMGMVLSRFLTEYAGLNSFVETVIVSKQRGLLKRWPPEIGERAAL